MNTVNDVRKYIVDNYPKITKQKFDLVKSGAVIYMFIVDQDGNLQREKFFRGPLPAASELPQLKKHVEGLIEKILKKWGYC